MSEVELRLKQYGCILGKLVLKSDSKPVSLGIGDILSSVVIYGICVVIHICNLAAVLGDISIGTVIQIVADKLHVPVKKVERAVCPGHPGSRDTVAPPASSTPPEAPGASHRLHHASCHIIEAPVVGIVGIQDDAQLALLPETALPGNAIRPCTKDFPQNNNLSA